MSGRGAARLLPDQEAMSYGRIPLLVLVLGCLNPNSGRRTKDLDAFCANTSWSRCNYNARANTSPEARLAPTRASGVRAALPQRSKLQRFTLSSLVCPRLETTPNTP